MKKEVILSSIDFRKPYTQKQIAELLGVKHSSRIGTSLKDVQSFKKPNPSGRGGDIKAYYGKFVKEALYYGKFDWAFRRNGAGEIPPPPETDFIPPTEVEHSTVNVLEKLLEQRTSMADSEKTYPEVSYDVIRAEVPNKTCKNVLRALLEANKSYIDQYAIGSKLRIQPDGVRPCISRLKREVGIPIMNRRGKGWKIAGSKRDWQAYLNSGGGRIVDIPFLHPVIAKEWNYKC